MWNSGRKCDVLDDTLTHWSHFIFETKGDGVVSCSSETTSSNSLKADHRAELPLTRNLKLPPGPTNIWAASLWLYQVFSQTQTRAHTHARTRTHTKDHFIKCQPHRKALLLQSLAHLWPQSMPDTSITSLQNHPWDILKVTNAALIWTAADIYGNSFFFYNLSSIKDAEHCDFHHEWISASGIPSLKTNAVETLDDFTLWELFS